MQERQKAEQCSSKESATAKEENLTQKEQYWGWQDTNETWEINPQTGKLETPEEREDRLEMEHLNRIYASFDYYRYWQFNRITRKEGHYEMLPPAMKKLIPNFCEKFKRMRECVSENQKFLSLMTRHPLSQAQVTAKGRSDTPSNFNMDKVRSTLKQCVRDWGEEGEAERKGCYGPILDTLKELYPKMEDRKGKRVLNPGCGLGRLTWEVARLGFSTQGNEFSYFMLLCSNIIINQLSKDEITIYPYIDQVTNQWSFEKQSRAISIPHIDPHTAYNNCECDYSICAGDFAEIYKDPNDFDVIASCFFLDTAKNVLEYLKVIAHILKPGGYLVNLGPLLYHFEDSGTDPSIELSYEELKNVLPYFGLKMIKEEKHLKGTYTRNCESMLRMHYECVLFVCEKTPTNIQPGLVYKPVYNQRKSNQLEKKNADSNCPPR